MKRNELFFKFIGFFKLSEKETFVNDNLNNLLYQEEIAGEKRVNKVALIASVLMTIVSIYIFFAQHQKIVTIVNIIIAIIGISYYTFFSFYLKKEERYKKFLKYISISFTSVMLTIILTGYSFSSGWIHSLRTMTLMVYLFIIIVTGFYQKPYIVFYTTILIILEYSIMFFYALSTKTLIIGIGESFQEPIMSYDLYITYILFFSITGILVAMMSTRLKTIFNLALISEEKAHENEMSRRVLEETMNIKSNFFANFAHEIKTPLTLITNYFNEYIKTSSESFEKNVIINNLEKLKKDITNFLDLENLEKGKYDFRNQEIVNFSKTLQMRILLFKETAKNKNIEIADNVAENLYCRIDSMALDMIINNLIENAIKYTNKNGKIFITLTADNKNITFSVTDTGIGIPEEQLENIFKPYYQLSHKKSNFQGLGLGLNIVKKILEEIQGSIMVESKIDQGSKFEVKLLKENTTGEVKISEKNSFENNPVIQYPDNILPQEKIIKNVKIIFIVEDNPEMLLFLIRNLKKEYNIFYAKNGKEALIKIKRIPKPDIIISDIMMDELDGFEFHSELIKIEKYKSIPFIYLTAMTTMKDKMKGLSQGAIDYIYKPFQMEELSAKIASIIKIQDAFKNQNIKKTIKQLYKHLENKYLVKNELIKESRNKITISNLYKDFKISKKQIKIITLLKEGLERKEICDKLEITFNTLNTHIKRIFKKCEVKNKTELLNIFY